MKINEIVKIPQQPTSGFDVNAFDVAHAAQVATSENIPVLHARGGTQDPSLHMYALKLDDQLVSMVIGAWGHMDGKPALFIKRTYTQPQYRNKGLVTALYNTLYNKLKFVIVSDYEMSPETISVWTKLAQTLPVKVLNVQTKQTVNFKDMPPDQIFNGDDNVRLVLECSQIPEWISIPESTGSTLRDYINYTHPENLGKYI